MTKPIARSRSYYSYNGCNKQFIYIIIKPNNVKDIKKARQNILTGLIVTVKK